MNQNSKECIEHAIKNIMSDNAFNELKLSKFPIVAKQIVNWLDENYIVISND